MITLYHRDNFTLHILSWEVWHVCLMNALLKATFTHLKAGQGIGWSRWEFGPLTLNTACLIVIYTQFAHIGIYLVLALHFFSIFIFTVFHVVLAALHMHNISFVIHFVQHIFIFSQSLWDSAVYITLYFLSSLGNFLYCSIPQWMFSTTAVVDHLTRKGFLPFLTQILKLVVFFLDLRMWWPLSCTSSGMLCFWSNMSRNAWSLGD